MEYVNEPRTKETQFVTVYLDPFLFKDAHSLTLLRKFNSINIKSKSM